MTVVRRRAALVLAGSVGALVGLLVGIVFSDPSPVVDSGPAPVVDTAAEAPPPESTGPPPPERVDPEPAVLLAWTSGGLPAGVVDAAERLEGVVAVTVVRGAQTDLVRSVGADGTVVDELADGWRIPIDTLAVEPDVFARFVDGDAATALAGLAPGEALLGETSARLRGLGPGGSIELATGQVEIVDVVDDLAIAGAELVVHEADAARLGAATERYALLSYEGDRASLQQRLADGPLAGRTPRFRSPVETTWLRHGDAVAPQSWVKATYGEFAYRDGPDRSVEIDPAWIHRSIGEATIPILGEVRCHRGVLDPLGDAMAELARANLGHLVDPAMFAGCFAPRRIEAGQPLSRHAWGIAVDLNVGSNPRGRVADQDPRLVETMQRHGFAWGGTWLVPDPAHYEMRVGSAGGSHR